MSGAHWWAAGKIVLEVCVSSGCGGSSLSAGFACVGRSSYLGYTRSVRQASPRKRREKIGKDVAGGDGGWGEGEEEEEEKGRTSLGRL